MYIYIYIYGEREREREIFFFVVTTYRQLKNTLLSPQKGSPLLSTQENYVKHLSLTPVYK